TIFDRGTASGGIIALVDAGTLFVQGLYIDFHQNEFATTNTMVNNDQWHHVAYVYDQGAYGFIRIYVDGVLAASNPNIGAWQWDAAQEIELGKSHFNDRRRYNGYLDDVQFYGRILSTAEVGQSMTLGPLI